MLTNCRSRSACTSVMRTSAALALYAATALSGAALAAGNVPSPTSYHVVHGWPSVPDGQALGWVVSGVGTDSHGHVFVFHRAGREWGSDDRMDLTPISRAT